MAHKMTDEEKQYLRNKIKSLSKEEIVTLFSEFMITQLDSVYDNLLFVDESVNKYKNGNEKEDLYFEALKYIVNSAENSKIIFAPFLNKIGQKAEPNE